MSSFRAKAVRTVTGAWFKTVNAETADIKRLRSVWHGLANALWMASGVSKQRTEVTGLNAEWLTPENSAEGKVMLYLHGGAYVFGNCTTHRQLVSYLARACGVRALLPEYRLAPEHPFPAAVEDAVALYRALRDAGHGAEDIVLAGDSAGGGLAMALLLSLRDSGEPSPAGAVLFSPWLDLASTGESIKTRAGRDPWFNPADMAVLSGYYAIDEQLRHPLVSPVYADVAGLPPLFIQVGEDEILLSDSERIAEKVQQAGGEVELEVWPEMWHVFQVFVHQMPESREAIRKVAPFVRSRLGLEETLEAGLLL